MEVNGQIHGPAALFRGNNDRYSMYMWLGGSQSRFGHNGEDKILFSVSGIEPGNLARSPLLHVLSYLTPTRLLYIETASP
jgi:hypothetical protein